MPFKKAMAWVGFWVAVALLVNLGVYIWMGHEKGLEFLAGYVTELSLSIDNLFLFVLVFSSFGLSGAHQRRVLNYGIIGAVVLRLVFVLLGITIINSFHWMLYVFGIILIASGVKMLVEKEQDFSYQDSKILKAMRKVIPVTDGLQGDRFFVRQGGKLFATPLLAIVAVIELTDIVFAIDSVPAVFAITTDPFIVYASNILAILGLRSMYFLLGSLHERFWLVKYGVAGILVFTGAKLGLGFFHVEIGIAASLIVIASAICGSIVLSLLVKKPEAPTEACGNSSGK